jgi:ABC-type nitrate/sulfonate/bicarbonate transport system substrate-binding protein
MDDIDAILTWENILIAAVLAIGGYVLSMDSPLPPAPPVVAPDPGPEPEPGPSPCPPRGPCPPR